MHLVKVDHHNGAMGLEITFPIPEGYGFLQVHGQGRIIGFLIQEPLQPPRAVAIHLDYPGVSVESQIPHTYSPSEAGSTVSNPLPPHGLASLNKNLVFQSYLWSICVPTESLAIVYNTQHILAYKIPNFSRLSPGVNPSNEVPMWYRPGLDPERSHDRSWVRVSYVTGETLYDPPTAQGFNLHYVFRECNAQPEPRAITVTIPIDINDDPASGPTEPPTLRRKLTSIRHHLKDSTEFSCQKGLHFEKAFLTEGLDILVTRLDDLTLEGGGEALRMFVRYKRLGYRPRTIEIDMDETTGRVVFWGWDKDAYETKVFVGDLV